MNLSIVPCLLEDTLKDTLLPNRSGVHFEIRRIHLLQSIPDVIVPSVVTVKSSNVCSKSVRQDRSPDGLTFSTINHRNKQFLSGLLENQMRVRHKQRHSDLYPSFVLVDTRHLDDVGTSRKTFQQN